jgi:hypothetical protein
MFPLLPPEKVSEQVPRLVPVLLGLYRRNVDPYPVTQCISAVLPVALAHNRSTVEPLLDNIQNIMFDLVSTFRFLLVLGKASNFIAESRPATVRVLSLVLVHLPNTHTDTHTSETW